MLNRRGLTLVEAAIALTIFGLIVSGVWVAFAKSSFNEKVARTERGVIQTAQNIRDFYGDRVISNASNLNNTQATTFKLIAPELTINGNIAHPLGLNGSELAFVGSDTAVCGATPDLFYIRLDAMNLEGCHQILARMLGNRGKVNENGIFSASVNGGNPMRNGMDFDVTNALNLCKGEDTVLFCFRHN